MVLALVLLATTAVMAAKGHAIKFCAYTSSVCDDESRSECYEGEAGKCLKAAGSGDSLSFTMACFENGINLTFYNSNDCSGQFENVRLSGSEGSCIVRNGLGATYENCNDGGGSGGDCFPADAIVELRDGSLKRMDEIATGDEVRVSQEEFSEVFFWGHKDADAVSTKYVLVSLASGRTITLSKNHLIYANDKLTPAKQLKIGDVLLETASGESVVARIDLVTKRGLYNPHTLHGDIVVDGVIASTHTALMFPALSHMLLAIERCAYRLGFSLFGSVFETERPAILTALMGALPSAK